ncbi:hypothetical protein DL95DRAFT_386890 [Leptodontidium sp. 2 PMI_412]|nr:hypothetical protein BKA61DRAFT_599908 [Leptodontidium sp. MPI-SDFR-AT-0119]KAH9217061.1 hypothetical protein DL95DRAFT_386890 [Leptodontidium sp. 2 PMI_412]
MSATVKTYIPSPNWDIPATSSLVKLGAIIKDPRNPESVLKSSSEVIIPDTAIQHGAKTLWSTTSTEITSGKLGLWAQCLQIVGLGGDVSFNALKSVLEEHKFETLDTTYFVPESVEGFLEKRVRDEYTQAYFEATSFRKPLFMISGIKIARGGVVESELKKEVGAEGKVGADLTALAVPITIGPELAWQKERSRSVKWAGSTDYVFAYRLVRIKCKKHGEFKVEGYNKGGVFGEDEDDEEEGEEKRFEDEYEVQEYEGEDYGIRDEVVKVE